MSNEQRRDQIAINKPRHGKMANESLLLERHTARCDLHAIVVSNVCCYHAAAAAAVTESFNA